MKKIPVAFICDENYAMPTTIAITSIKESRNRSILYSIYVLGVGLSILSKKKLLELDEEGFTVTIIDEELSDTQKKVVQTRERVTLSALLKFDLPYIFSEYEKILYLDSDVVVQKDLEPLFDTDIHDVYAAVVNDTMTYKGKAGHLKSLGFRPAAYFNSGMLLLNLEKMREDDMPSRLLEYRLNGINRFMDQDALNVVFDGNVKFISPYYNLLNCFFEWDTIPRLSEFYGIEFPDNVIDIYENATVLHFGDKKKPWQCNMGALSQIYINYYYASPYSNIPLILEATDHNDRIVICGDKPSANLPEGERENPAMKRETDGDIAPKVSVIMPSLNVRPYICECVESVISQTLRDIEIICVDAGSTDGTLEILQEYAKIDSRIKVIISDKKSYGYQMNLGLDAAKGQYIGIVETDDWAEATMFETLWTAAAENDADMVKSNYFWYTTKPNVQNKPFDNLKNCSYGKVFHPIKEDRTIFTTTPAIWSGIYRREMLVSECIRFNETPGASYQDTSFHFMVCTVARKCYLLKEHFLHYRRDNEGSSVNSSGKVYCVSDEMHYYEAFLNDHKEYRDEIITFFQALKYEKYRWNYERLAPQFQYEFLELMHNEFSSARKDQLLDQSQFPPAHWNAVSRMVENPLRYFEDTCKVYSTRMSADTEYSYTVLRSASICSPKVSVIIPVYNYEDYIGMTIESVLDQTLADIEVICVNDGSTDNTLDVLIQCAEGDERVTVCTQINKGQSAARNVGIGLARGDYIEFVDADDLIRSNALETLYGIAVERDLDVLYFDGESMFESKELELKYPHYRKAYEYTSQLPDILTGSALFTKMRSEKQFRASPCLSIYRKDYLLDSGIRFVDGIIHEDNIFSAECMIMAKRVAHIKDKFYLRRVHPGSTMTQPKSFRHFYGYLSCIMELQRFALSLKFDEALYTQLRAEIDTLTQMALSVYNVLDKEASLKKLNQIERWYFEKLIKRPVTTSVATPANSQSEASLICASASYKIGRFITFVPRKVRGGIRCYREHGIRYTLHRLLIHLHLKKDI